MSFIANHGNLNVVVKGHKLDPRPPVIYFVSRPPHESESEHLISRITRISLLYKH